MRTARPSSPLFAPAAGLNVYPGESAEAKQGRLIIFPFRVLDIQQMAATTFLLFQYRMNERIAVLTNHLTYESKLWSCPVSH